MSLIEKLRHDLQQAMRARDERRKAALRMVLTAVQLADAEAEKPLTDEDVVRLIQKEVRRREDALVMIRQAGRDDLIADEERELDILRAYLPRMMTAEEIEALARQVIAEVGATSPRDMGKVMKVIMPQLKGKADGRAVSTVVRVLLSRQDSS